MEIFANKPLPQISDMSDRELMNLGRDRLCRDGIEIQDLDSAGDKLAKIKDLAVELADGMSRLTPELYNEDRDEFGDLSEDAEKKMMAIEVLLIELEVRAETEYSPTIFWTWIFLYIFGFLPRAARVLQGLKTRRQCRKAFLKARREYAELMEGHRGRIFEIVNANVIQLQKRMLATDGRYQQLIDDVNALGSKGYRSDDDAYRLRLCKKQMKSMEEQALVVARDCIDNGVKNCKLPIPSNSKKTR